MIHSASIPAIAMAAVKLYVAGYFLLVWLRVRRSRENLAFALTCLAVVVYDLGCAGLYNASTPLQGAPWQWLQRLSLGLAGVAFAWFIADYTRRLPRAWLYGLTAWGGAHSLLLAVAPRLFLSSEPSVKLVHLPWGVALAFEEVALRPWSYALEAFGALLFAVVLFAAIGQFRSGERGRATPLLAGIVVLAAGVLNDVAVSLGLVPSLYAIEYAFLGLVLIMSFRLSGEHGRVGRMEAALRESEERYRTLVEGTDDLVLQIDQRGRLLYANRGAAEAFGVPAEVLRDLALPDLVQADQRPLLVRAFADWTSGPRVGLPTFEARHVNAADQPLDVFWRLTPLTDDSGSIVLFNAIGRDITERKRVEEELFARFQRLEREQEAILSLTNDEAVVGGTFTRAVRRITETAAETLGVERVAVWRVTPGGRSITCVDVYERSPRRHSAGATVSTEGSTYFERIVSDRAVVSSDAQSDPRLAEFLEPHLRPLGVTARLEAPVRMAGWFAGTVCIEHVGSRRTWLDDEIIFVGELADQVAQALLNADRHKAEESLRASEARYRSMLEAMDDLVYISSTDYRVQYMNPAMVRRTGRDATGEPCYQAMHGLAEICGWCSDTRRRRGDSPRWEITSPKDGRTYSVSNVPLHNQDGTVSKMSILRDITDVRQAEAERVLLSAAIEQAAEIVLLTDTDGVIQYVNPAFEQVTGYSRAEAVGRTPAILKSGKQSRAFYDDLWNTIRSGKTWTGRFTNRKKDGSLYLEEAIISPVLDRNGRIANYVSVKRDITSQVRLEEQLRQAQKMEAVGQLAGGVAHDFNNLLTPILGYAELLQARFAPQDPTHAALAEIRRAGEGARRLTAQLLAFGRKQVIEMRVLELGGLVARMSRMLRRTIREDIEIVFKRAPEPSRFRGDVSQIEQVVMNLAVNAQDAMPQGGRMSVETENVSLDQAEAIAHQGRKGGPYVVLAVSDTGVGMDGEILSHLFEPFFTTKEKGKGTGLGLATAYGIVKQHGGEITVSSEPGRGSTFKVYLPRTTDLDLEAERPAAATRAALHGTETIAVVEDNPMVRSIAVAMLTAHGYQVLAAAGGEDCLQQMAAHDGPVHLLLADVIMPGMNGRELYRRALAQRPALRVLFMSGYTEDIIAPQGVLEHDVDFIPKPFSAESLTHKVREILNR